VSAPTGLLFIFFHPPQLKAGFGDRCLDHAAVEIVGRRRVRPDDADRVYTAEWRAFVEGKYGTPPTIEYLHSPVMVDNSAGTISVAA
jgi:hypothetical protein